MITRKLTAPVAFAAIGGLAGLSRVIQGIVSSHSEDPITSFMTSLAPG